MSLVNVILTAALVACVLALIALRRGAARARNDLCTLRAATSELRHLADHDSLTGLPNRRRFEQELARHLAHVRRYGPGGALLVLDLDCFKPVNDSLGHAAGDRLLTRVAAVLHERLRATDLIARLGGDEFAVLLPRVDRAGATVVARSLVETVRAAVPAAETRAVTISVGVLTFDGDALASASAPTSALAAADLAMYDAKAAGGDGFAFYAEPRVAAAAAPPALSATAPAAAVHLPAVAVT